MNNNDTNNNAQKKYWPRWMSQSSSSSSATMNVGYRKKRTNSIIISPTTHVTKKKKTSRKQGNLSNPQPTAAKKKDPKVIDLTFAKEEDLLPGTPLDIIKSEHSLFFMYNPRGYKMSKKLPRGYCLHCRCPNSYCAERIFGKMCADHGYSILLEQGTINDFDDSDVRFFYKKAYTEAVSNKMRWNNISFGCEHSSITLFDVPECIKRGSLSNLQKEIKKNTKLEGNYPSTINLDIEVGDNEEEEDI
jgi:hypothetical protein